MNGYPGYCSLPRQRWRKELECSPVEHRWGPVMVSIIGNTTGFDDYAEVARKALEADQCALVVVDIQQKLLPPIFEKERLLRNSQLLIRLAHILNLPVLATTQYVKGLGSTV